MIKNDSVKISSGASRFNTVDLLGIQQSREW